MEVGAIPTLTAHASLAEDYPELQKKLHAHLEATRYHARQLEGCIERLGGRPSVLKEAVSTVLGKVGGVANLPAKDSVIKNLLGDYAAENFEIASYKSLIAAAEKIGDTSTAEMCRRILRDEEEMAGWLGGHIPTFTQAFLTEQLGEGAQAQPTSDLSQTPVRLEKGSSTSAGPSGALLASGALLVGVGAAFLVSRALRSGADEDQKSPYRGRVSGPYGDAQGGEFGSSEQIGAEPAAAFQSEPLELPEAQGVSAGAVSPYASSGSALTDDLSNDPGDEHGNDLSSDLSDNFSDDSGLLGEPSSEQAGVDALVYTEVWLIPGPYTGIGPSYDSAGDPLGQEVASRLTQHGEVDASNIEITIDGGEVLLEGTVDSDETKRLAEEAIARIENVRSVQNLLVVRGS